MTIGKPKEKTKKGSTENSSWQAQKSAMTRDRILDAAIECFIKLGYTNTTTAKVADYGGVSRGAMLHHFPSKTELIQAAVEYLHEKLLIEYSMQVSQIPQDLSIQERNRAGLRAYWNYLSSDLFVASHELSIAGRTDPELQTILQNSIIRFDQHVIETNKEFFSEWSDHGERFLLAMDVTKFLMEGMAVGQIVQQREKRINRLLDYLADRLEEMFEEGFTQNSAIGRHSS